MAVTLDEFHNLCRVMQNLDRDELCRAGVLDDIDAVGWELFQENPTDWFIKAPSGRAERLFNLMLLRAQQ